MIDLAGITKKFYPRRNKSVIALDGINLRCRSGDVYGLLGPNGAGKTTLMRVISTALRPTNGSGTICGFDLVSQSAQIRSCIGFLSGDFGLYGRLSGREYLTYFGRLYGMPLSAIEERIALLSDTLEMKPFLDRRCESYSTGMRQKISIGRATLHSPRLLLLDEATSNLDILASKNLIELVHSFRHAGTAILYATHRMSEVERLCNKLTVMAEGRIVFSGTPADLRSSYDGHLDSAYLRLVENASMSSSGN